MNALYKMPVVKIMRTKLAVVCLLLSAVGLHAETYYVSTDGLDTQSGVGGWENALKNVPTAISKANQAGDAVWLSNGTHYIAGALTVNLDITLRGYTTNAAETIIDGGYPGQTNRCLTLNHSGALVRDLAVQNGCYAVQAWGGGGIYINSGGMVSNCIVRSNRCARGGGGIHINQNGLVSDSIIIDNVSTAGNGFSRAGGVYINVTGRVERCQIARNSAYHGGGAAIAQNGMLFDLDVLANTSSYSGAGVYIVQKGQLLNCNLIGNSATAEHSNAKGGGVMAASDVMAVEIRGGTIISNYAYYGGGVYGGALTEVHAVEIITNTCARDGGGGYGGKYTDCTIADNYAGAGGGGLYSPHSVYNSIIASNDSFTFGGGVYLYGAQGTVTISNCEIFANTVAANTGGGIAIRGSAVAPVVEIVDCLISNNQLNGTAMGGGGIGADNLNDMQAMVVHRCVIVDNTSNGRGGGMYFTASSGTGVLDVCNSLIAGNVSGLDGGGVYLDVVGGGMLENCTVMSNSAVAGKIAGIWASSTLPHNIANTIVYDNKDENDTESNYLAAANLYFTNCCVSPMPAQAVDTITTMPAVVDASAGNFRLNSGSPCINRGLNKTWMDTAPDLDGRSRIDRFSGLVDIGCYEYISRGTLYNLR